MVDGLSENEREMVKRVAHLPKRACAFVDEGLMVGTDVLVLDRGEDSHLVERILFLFVGEFAHLDLLEGVLDAIALPYDRIDATVSALTFCKDKNERDESLSQTGRQRDRQPASASYEQLLT